jgi:hypothetical protein
MGKPATGPSGESGNTYASDIKNAFSPGFNYFNEGGDMMANLLGVGPGGTAAQTSALNNFANSGGMQFLMDQGQKAITSSKAAQGLLQSGSYGTALEKYGQGLASTYLNQYMDNLYKLSGLGLNAGQLVTQAGQYSKNSSGKPAKQGILPTLLQVGAAAATGGGSLAAGAGGLMPLGLDTSIASSLPSMGSPIDILSGAGYPTL